MANNKELSNYFNSIDNIMRILKATGELFISVHLFDLKNNQLIPIKSNERIESLSEKYSSAQDIVSFVMENLSVPETLGQIQDFTNLSTLPKRLKDKKMLSHLFQGKYLGWCKTIFIKLDDEKDPLRYVLCVVQSVDKDIKRLEELKEKAKENSKLNAILNGLMKEYTTVCSVNLNTEEVEFLRLTDKSKRLLGEENLDTNYHRLLGNYANKIYDNDRNAIKEFFDFEEVKKLEQGSSKSIVYRDINGEYGEAKIIKTGDHYALIGFSDKNKEIEEIQEAIYTDSLTGVRNRKYYDKVLAKKSCQGLVISDIDLFKTINDKYGHLVGDEVLVTIAKALKSCVRKTDDIVRYGGDEFILYFEDITKEALEAVLEKMRKKIYRTKIENYPNLNLSMSFGAVYGDSTAENMISNADDALYVSKENRNTVTMFTPKTEKTYKKTIKK